MKLDIYILIVTITTVAVGLLLGLLRGSRRAVLRLLLVLLCVVGAYFLKDVVTGLLMKTDIQGQTVEQMIIGMLPAQMQGMGDAIMPLVTVIISVVSFLLCFGLLLFVTWAILFPILKIFVKKGKKKHALVGGIVGAVQGVAVAFVMCVILNGLFVNVGNVMAAMEQEQPETNASIFLTAEADGNASGDGQQSAADISQLITSINEYKQSGISKMYSKFGDKAFDLVASVKMTNEDGETEKITLKGQMDAVSGLLKLAKNAEKFSNINFGTNGIVGCADDIKEVFDMLDDINKNLNDESRKTLNRVVESVAESMLPPDLPIDVTVIDFTTVDFAVEGQIITDLSVYASKTDAITEQDAENIVKKVTESNLIIPLLTSTGEIDLKLGDEQKAKASEIIAKYETDNTYDASKIAQVKEFFGLSSAN